MDSVTKAIADGYIKQMEEYDISGSQLQQEVEDWKNAVYSLARECGNSGEFTEAMMQGPLFTQMSDLIYRINMANYQGSQEAKDAGAKITAMRKTAEKPEKPVTLPTVQEFLNQYRAGYDEVKKTIYREETIKAYEELFQVAERTDDLQDCQLILEKEGLVRKMTAIGGREPGEKLLEAMDPLMDIVVAPTEEQVNVYKDFLCPEEVTYRGELMAQRAAYRVAKGRFLIWLCAAWALLVMEYQKGKLRLRQWSSDREAEAGYRLMAESRQKMRQLHQVMERVMGISWEEMMEDEFMTNRLLNPEGVDELWRCKAVLLPDNLQVIREIVEDEVLSDETIPQILQREQKNVFIFGLTSRNRDKAIEEYTERAAEKNEKIPYFQYVKRLSREEMEAFKKSAGVSGENNSLKTLKNSKKGSQTVAPAAVKRPDEEKSVVGGLKKLFRRG